MQVSGDTPFVLRDLRIGDVGWVIHRQAELYAREYGWDVTFEALLAEIGAEFIRKFDASGERGWIAERDGTPVGAVLCVRASALVAKLRLLHVEPQARGLGIGAALVDACIAFARDRGYSTLTLWTNDVLVAARHIYESRGFRLTSQESHHSFGKDLVGQYWELDLEAPAPRR
jgi:GNAT superfamily N-acetyltransferase